MKKLIYTKPLVSETNFEAETFFMSGGASHEGLTPATASMDLMMEDYE